MTKDDEKVGKPRIWQMFTSYKPDSFIGKYMDYMKDTETPSIYDFWCALWVLSTALGGRTIVPRPQAPVNLNLYVVLVAQSGVTRKSTAVRTAEQIVNKLFAATDDKTPIISTKTTPEAFVHDLHLATQRIGKAHAAVCVSELVTMLGRERYLSAMPGLLTDLYDCPAERRSFGSLLRGETLLRKVYINFLSASTPSWLLESINPNVVAGGFTSRCMFICAEKRKRLIAWSDMEWRDDQHLVDMLLKIRETSFRVPKIEITEKALNKFRHWYKNREEHTDEFRTSFESREDAHVLKVAALLSVNRNAWEISVDDIQNALALVQQTKDAGAAIFEDIHKGHNYAFLLDKIRAWLTAAGNTGVEEDWMVRALRNHVKAAWVRHALAVMHELNMLRKIEVERTGVRTTICVAAADLMSSDVVTEAINRVAVEL